VNGAAAEGQVGYLLRADNGAERGRGSFQNGSLTHNDDLLIDSAGLKGNRQIESIIHAETNTLLNMGLEAAHTYSDSVGTYLKSRSDKATIAVGRYFDSRGGVHILNHDPSAGYHRA